MKNLSLLSLLLFAGCADRAAVQGGQPLAVSTVAPTLRCSQVEVNAASVEVPSAKNVLDKASLGSLSGLGERCAGGTSIIATDDAAYRDVVQTVRLATAGGFPHAALGIPGMNRDAWANTPSPRRPNLIAEQDGDEVAGKLIADVTASLPVALAGAMGTTAPGGTSGMVVLDGRRVEPSAVASRVVGAAAGTGYLLVAL